MKIIICLIASFSYLALADAKDIKESIAVATDKGSDSKPKRDASLQNGVYHGPSYKYLPPSSIYPSYSSYPGSIGNSAGFSGIGNGYSIRGAGQSHHGLSSANNQNGVVFHGFDYAPASSYSSDAHGLGFTSSNPYVGRGSIKHFGTDPIGGAIGYSDRPYLSAIGHGYDSSASRFSSVGYKSHPLVGTGGDYHYSKGMRGTVSAPSSSRFGSAHGLSSSLGPGLHEEHVHNGAQEHIYVISNEPASFTNLHDAVSVSKKGSHVVPTGSYLPQGKHPSASTVGDSYSTNYHSQDSKTIAHEPAYAAGHKGLGYFSFVANKPKVLHTSISDTSFPQPSYSKAPFKPSTFLGVNLESSAPNVAPGQQYSSLLGAASDSTGYDYTIPSNPSINYQEPSYQQSVGVQQNTAHEQNSSYLPAKGNGDSLNEISSAPSDNYLPPSNSYGVPYSH